MTKYIHYCWFGRNPKPKKLDYYITTWKKYLPDFEIIEWNEDNFDVNSHEFVKAAYQAKKWAFVSDYVRVYALEKMGGFYFDTDIEIINPVDFFFEHEIVLGRESEEFLATAMIYVKKPHNKHIKNIMKFYNGLVFDPENVFKYTNPKIFTDYFKKIGLKDGNESVKLKDNICIYAKEYFNPKSYDGKNEIFTNNTCIIHHFDATWTPLVEKIAIWFVRRKMDFMVKPVYKIHNILRRIKRLFIRGKK
ncbi:MAG: glycosyl transferase [Bacilli bacterium]|nr:glycosyl transferase [Bacilli bacterium]